MQLNKADNIIMQLKDLDSENFPQGLQCWIKEEEKYNIYIFSIQVNDEDKLKAIQGNVRDYVTIYFQGQLLKKEVERWNIYQVFFVEESISKDIKQQIEQDKFATRKMVFDNLGHVMKDEEIDQRINTEIFEFVLTANKTTSNTLIDSLEKEDATLFYEIVKANGDINLLLNPIENE